MSSIQVTEVFHLKKCTHVFLSESYTYCHIDIYVYICLQSLTESTSKTVY